MNLTTIMRRAPVTGESEAARAKQAKITETVGFNLLSRAWSWLAERRRAQLGSRRLRVAETVSLGEKRFAALIEVDGVQYLVGGGAATVELLATLPPRTKQEEGDAISGARA